MNKEFIPYEQALELKELGFNEECIAYYHTDIEKNKVGFDARKKLEINSYSESFDEKDFVTNKDEWDYYITAPLYQQAFRWFREKYGLFSAVNVDQTMEPKFAYCISKYWTDALSWGWDTIVFNSDLHYTYEDAELACLKNLIEIIKNK